MYGVYLYYNSNLNLFLMNKKSLLSYMLFIILLLSYIPTKSFSTISINMDSNKINSKNKSLLKEPEKDCGISLLPYSENFDDYTPGLDAFPDCWEKLGGDISQTYISSTHNSAPGSLQLYAPENNIVIVVLPEVNVESVDIKSLQANFKLYSSSDEPVLKVGIIDIDLNNPENYDFSEILSINPKVVNAWDEFDIFLQL